MCSCCDFFVAGGELLGDSPGFVFLVLPSRLRPRDLLRLWLKLFGEDGAGLKVFRTGVTGLSSTKVKAEVGILKSWVSAESILKVLRDCRLGSNVFMDNDQMN